MPSPFDPVPKRRTWRRWPQEAFDIVRQSIFIAEVIHLNRVIDHQIGRHQRIGFGRVGAQFVRRAAHLVLVIIR